MEKVEVEAEVGARHAVEAYLGGGERPAQRARKQQVDPGLARGLARPQLQVELPRLHLACRREARVPQPGVDEARIAPCLAGLREVLVHEGAAVADEQQAHRVAARQEQQQQQQRPHCVAKLEAAPNL